LTYPVLESLKKFKTNLNKEQFIKLPADTPFGNLNLNWMEMIIRIECINEMIVSLYTEFDALKILAELNSDLQSNLIYRHRFYNEQIFYWLRKTADELISLISLLEFNDNKKVFPKKIEISSIGEFLKEECIFNDEFTKFKNFLITLNEISNGFKHSFINSQANAYIGSEYPVVFALTLHYNNLKNKPKFYSLNLRDVLIQYDEFLKHSKEFIKNNFELKD
jgi:hypothetical protein